MPFHKITILFLILFGYAIVLSLFRMNQNYIPNWDTLCYLSLAYNVSGEKDSVQRHLMAYEQFQEKTDSVTFLNHTNSKIMSESHNNYRKICFDDYSAFTQQEIFHKSKFFYIITAIAISKFGYDLYDAFHLISFWSVIFLILFFVLILRKYFSLPLSIIISFIIYFHPSIYEIQMLGTPDALSAMLIFAFYFFLSNEYNRLKQFNGFMTLLFGILAVITRSENIIFILPIFTIYWILKSRKRVFSFHYVFFAFSLFMLAYLNSYMQDLSWKLIFYHSFIDLQLYPLAFDNDITVRDYFVILYQNFVPFFYQNHLWIYFILLIIITFKRVNTIYNFNYFMIITFIATSIFLRFALYPFPDERYYIHFFIVPFIFYDLIESSKTNLLNSHKKS